MAKNALNSLLGRKLSKDFGLCRKKGTSQINMCVTFVTVITKI